MARITLIKIAEARKQGADGVDYSPRLGAICPWCGNKAKVYKTMPWEDNTRVRYHHCVAAGCAMAMMDYSIKSIEVDQVADIEQPDNGDEQRN